MTSAHPRPARACAEARLAAAAAARARNIAALQSRAAHLGARAAAVAARERARRACDAQKRADKLADKLATAAARRAARAPCAGRARARLARARARREARLVARDGRKDASRLTGRASRLSGRASRGMEETRAVAVVEETVLMRKARRALGAAGLSARILKGLAFKKLAEAVQRRAAMVGAARALRAAGVRPTHGAVRMLLATVVVALQPGTAGGDVGLVRRARNIVACLYVGTAVGLGMAWRKWPAEFAKWRRKDRIVLLEALADDAVTTDAMMMGSKWKAELEAHLESIRKAARYVDGVHVVEDARVRARQRVDDAIVHEILVDIKSFLKKVEEPHVLPLHIWQSLERELAAGAPGEALAVVLDALDRSLNGMIPNSFISPPLDDANAWIVLERACVALRAAQPPAADDALTDWEEEARARLQRGDIIHALRDLTHLVFATAARVRTIRIRDVIPLVTDHGHSWERERFSDLLRFGTSTLPLTSAMLIDAQVISRQLPPVLPHIQRALRAGVATLLATDSPIPEILHLDIARISTLRISARAAAHTAALAAALRGLGVPRPDIAALSIAPPAAALAAAVTQVSAHPPDFAARVLERATGRPAALLLDRVAAACAHAQDARAHLPVALRCVALPVCEIAQAAAAIADHAVRVHADRVSPMLAAAAAPHH